MIVVDLPTNSNGTREAAVRDAKAGMSRADLAARYGMSDGWAGGIRREAGVAGRGKEVAAGPVPKVPSAVGPARASAPPRQRTRRPPAGMIVSAAAVALVAAVISYVHVMHLALQAGSGWLGYLAPVPLDGLVVASTYALVVTRTGKLVARVGIVVGFAGSVAMNVIAVWPGLVDLQLVAAALAGFAPIALLATGHIVLQAANER